MSKYDVDVLRHELVYLRGLRLSRDPRLAEAAARREAQVQDEIAAAGVNFEEVPQPAAA